MAIKINGSTNRGRGYTFRVLQSQGMPYMDILITTVKERRVPPFRIFIYLEPKHKPHVHIGVSDDVHEAGFLLSDGMRCMGKCDKRHAKYMQEWIMSHQRELLHIWNDVQRGIDVTKRIERLNSTEVNYDAYFDDVIPEHKTVEGCYHVWYDGDLAVSTPDSSIIIKSTGRIRVLKKEGATAINGRYPRFVSAIDDCIIKSVGVTLPSQECN